MGKAINWVLLIIGLLFVFMLFFPSTSHRYAMTFEVLVGNEIHAGSSVIQVNNQQEISLIGSSMSVQGQAAFIDLGTRGVVLMALGGSGDPNTVPALYLTYNAYKAAGLIPKDKSFEYSFRELKKEMERVPLLPDNRPQFIWLSDRNDPSTARPVKAEEFSTVIAPEVSFHGAWVQTTRQPVTKGLAKKLPWLPKFAEPRIVLEHPSRFTLVSALLTQGISL